MTDFAPSVDHCRRAFGAVTARLPAGFIPSPLFPLWMDAIRSGRAGDRKIEQTLQALLPDTDQWPALTPICCRFIDEPPQFVFLRTLTSTAYAIGRAERQAVTAKAMPLRRFSATQDTFTAPEHLALHGTIKLLGDVFWTRFDADPWWGCRCSSTTMNERTATRRA